MVKRYCAYCHYMVEFYSIRGGSYYKCSHPKSVFSSVNWLDGSTKFYYSDCEDINKKNECEYYKDKEPVGFDSTAVWVFIGLILIVLIICMITNTI